jgi:hypothetical protein
MAQPWSNKIVGYGEVTTEDILAHPYNWRIHPAHQQAALKGVLDDVGIVQNILINKRTSEEWPAGDRGVDTLLDGHARVQLALRHGQVTLPVTYCDLTPAEETEILLTLDPLSTMATRDDEHLMSLMQDIQSADASVLAMLTAMIQPPSAFTPNTTPETSGSGHAAASVQDSMQNHPTLVAVTCPACLHDFYVEKAAL